MVDRVGSWRRTSSGREWSSMRHCGRSVVVARARASSSGTVEGGGVLRERHGLARGRGRGRAAVGLRRAASGERQGAWSTSAPDRASHTRVSHSGWDASLPRTTSKKRAWIRFVTGPMRPLADGAVVDLAHRRDLGRGAGEEDLVGEPELVAREPGLDDRRGPARARAS